VWDLEFLISVHAIILMGGDLVRAKFNPQYTNDDKLAKMRLRH
jgi:hypothetical protein